jgi:hypothetical protein
MNVELSLQALEEYLCKEDQVAVTLLLLNGPESWERRFKPLPKHSSTVAEVVVSCTGDLAVVGLMPHSPTDRPAACGFG